MTLQTLRTFNRLQLRHPHRKEQGQKEKTAISWRIGMQERAASQSSCCLLPRLYVDTPGLFFSLVLVGSGTPRANQS